MSGTKRWWRALVLLTVSMFLLLGASAASSAARSNQPLSVTCSGTLSGGHYLGVFVPEGAECNLFDAFVIGKVEAAPGSGLQIRNSKIIGRVLGNHAMWVQVSDSFVVGGISIVGAGDSPSGITEVYVADLTVVGTIEIVGGAGTTLIDRNRIIAGTITVTNNFVPPFLAYPSQLSVRNNQVNGNMTVSRNTGPGLKQVFSNNVKGRLTCEQNEAPLEGSPNTARVIVGQCS